MSGKSFLYEKQQFTHKWVFAVLLLVFSGLAVLLVYALISHDVDVWSIGVAIVFVLLLSGLFARMALHVSIEQDCISFRFAPLQWKYKVIKKEDVRSVSLTKFRPLADYGGWGIRVNGKSTAYIISGNDGINIELANGKHLLIGTANAQEVNVFFQENWREKYV